MEIGKRVKASAPLIANADTRTKNQALLATAEILNSKRRTLIAENNKDLEAARERKIGAALIDRSLAEDFLPRYAREMEMHQVEIRACEKCCAILPNIKRASEADWHEEYLAPIIAIKVVADIDDAIAHIKQYGSHHTDAIVSRDYARTMRFLREVDSSSVMVNASTRFADGYEYGLGAEIGISTDRLHVRGPVGLEGLTIQKYIVFGDGHIRE